MAEHLTDLVPDANELLAMNEEQLGFEILEVIKTWEASPIYQQNREHFIAAAIEDRVFGRGYGRGGKEEEIRGAISRAWDYAVRVGYLIPDPRFLKDVYKLGQKGKDVLSKPREKRSTGNWKIVKEHLHPLLRESAWSAYQRAEYDTAVFSAMKAVEVAVRTAANLPNNQLGVALMRTAFDPNKGVLTDASAEGGERQAMSDLFAGSIGTFKNPSSHRSVAFDDPDAVTEILLLANHLLRIVDVRKASVP